MSKIIDITEFVKSLHLAKDGEVSLDTSFVYSSLSTKLSTVIAEEILLQSTAQPTLDLALIRSSPAVCFVDASSSELAKNLLDPRLSVTAVEVTVKIDYFSSTIHISLSDNGPGFPLDKVPVGRLVPAAEVLEINGPLSRGKTTKHEGDGSGGGCGRGFAQIIDWFDALKLDTHESLRIGRVNSAGGCVVVFSSTIATSIEEKDRCDQAVASVLSDFSTIKTRGLTGQEVMEKIQDALAPDYASLYTASIGCPATPGFTPPPATARMSFSGRNIYREEIYDTPVRDNSRSRMALRRRSTITNIVIPYPSTPPVPTV